MKNEAVFERYEEVKRSVKLSYYLENCTHCTPSSPAVRAKRRSTKQKALALELCRGGRAMEELWKSYSSYGFTVVSHYFHINFACFNEISTNWTDLYIRTVYCIHFCFFMTLNLFSM